METNKLERFALIISCIILFPYLVFRLINQAKILTYFPLDITNDISSHMAQLYFLKTCGFHNLCSYWYNGFNLLKFYPPGWFFFAYPLLIIFKRPEIATYISIILMLIVSFIAIYKIISLKGKSWLKSISFFLFLFATATSISGFFRLGRVTELFAWMIFLILTYIILKYKDKKIDINFIWFIPFYAILLFAQPIVAIPFHFFLLSLFIAKRKSKKELGILFLSVFFGLLLSSFWWYPFIRDLGSEENRTYEYLPEILSRWWWPNGIDLNYQWTSSILLVTAISLITLIIFGVYYLSKRDKNDLLFYSPILLLAFLVLFRIVTIIPYVNFVYPEPYFTFFIIFILIFLFNLNLQKLPNFLQKSIPICIILITISSTIMSITITSYYTNHTSLEITTIDLLKQVKGPYVILESPSSTSYSKAYYSYGSIYLNLTTPSGWSPSELSDKRQKLLVEETYNFEYKNCWSFIKTAKKINLKEVITYGDFCDWKDLCAFKERIDKNGACLLRI